MTKSREAWDLFHERVGTCMAHLSTTAALMGQARQEPGAAAKVPPAVVSSLQESLESLSRLQEESRLRSAAAARVAAGVQRAGMAGGGAAGATGDDEEEGEAGGSDASSNTPEAVFLRSGGVVALHKAERTQVEAKVSALNVQGLRRWKEVMEAMGEGGGDDDVEVEVEVDAAAPSTKCPVTGMDMVNPLRRYVLVAWGGESGRSVVTRMDNIMHQGGVFVVMWACSPRHTFVLHLGRARFPCDILCPSIPPNCCRCAPSAATARIATPFRELCSTFWCAITLRQARGTRRRLWTCWAPPPPLVRWPGVPMLSARRRWRRTMTRRCGCGGRRWKRPTRRQLCRLIMRRLMRPKRKGVAAGHHGWGRWGGCHSTV